MASIRPKPGVYNGTHFRSQLEISWAKWFDEQDIAWDYIDESYVDFALYPDDEQLLVEVKPQNHEICWKAIKRIAEAFFEGAVYPGDELMLFTGSPPSCYGQTLVIAIRPIRYDIDYDSDGRGVLLRPQWLTGEKLCARRYWGNRYHMVPFNDNEEEVQSSERVIETIIHEFLEHTKN